MKIEIDLKKFLNTANKKHFMVNSPEQFLVAVNECLSESVCGKDDHPAQEAVTGACGNTLLFSSETKQEEEKPYSINEKINYFNAEEFVKGNKKNKKEEA